MQCSMEISDATQQMLEGVKIFQVAVQDEHTQVLPQRACYKQHAQNEQIKNKPCKALHVLLRHGLFCIQTVAYKSGTVLNVPLRQHLCKLLYQGPQSAAQTNKVIVANM